LSNFHHTYPFVFKHQGASIGIAPILPPNDVQVARLLPFLPPHFHERRRNEWLCSRILLEKVSGKEAHSLQYTPEGKPFFPDDGKIGISHSRQFAAVIWHPQLEVGIDVEELRPQLFKIKEKFLSATELAILHPEDLHTLTAFWCAKEALYKWYGLKELQFNQHIVLQNVQLTCPEQAPISGFIDAVVKKNSIALRAAVQVTQFQNTILAYVIANGQV